MAILAVFSYNQGINEIIMKKKILILAVFVISAATIVFISNNNAFAESDRCSVTGSNITPKELCAGRLYRRDSGVRQYCKSSNAKTTCEDEIKPHLDCPGVYSNDCKGDYASKVAKIILKNNVDPCGSGTYGGDSCKKSSSNWKYYYSTDPNSADPNSADKDDTNGGDADKDNGGDSSDDDDDSNGAEDAPPVELEPVEEGACTSILPSSWCTNRDSSGIQSIVSLIITILTGGVVVAGTIGLIICGVMWMTARDNENQVATAKKRMMEIVIGIVAWVLIYALANLFIPKTSQDIEKGNIQVDSSTGSGS